MGISTRKVGIESLILQVLLHFFGLKFGTLCGLQVKLAVIGVLYMLANGNRKRPGIFRASD